MRLLGAALVRNEADIVEAFVRHNLALLDGIAIVDHGSIDATPDILRSLADEGLQVFVARDETAAFDQEPMLNRLVRHIFSTSDAAWVFPLDADEFLRTASRAALDATLASLGAVTDVTLEWSTYVPDFERCGDTLACLRSARRVRNEGHGLRKVALSRSFADDAELYVTNGQHRVKSRKRPRTTPPRALPADALSIAHVPIRSVAQFTQKIALGWLSNLAAPVRVPNQSVHWREAFALLRSGRTFTPQELVAFAVNYSVPMAEWLPVHAHQLVDDPFLRDFALRYPRGATPDPLASVLHYAERLLRAQAPPR